MARRGRDRGRLVLLVCGRCCVLVGTLAGRRSAGRRVCRLGRAGAGGRTDVDLEPAAQRVRPLRLAGAGELPIARLAVRNGAAIPSRSTLTIGPDRGGQFSDRGAERAFVSIRPAKAADAASGSGGFDLVAQSDQPIYQDLEFAPSRPRGAGLFGRRRAICLHKCNDGEPARAERRRRQLLEPVPAHAAAHAGRDRSRWSSAADSPGPRRPPTSPEEKQNPWLLLDKKLPDDADGTPVRAGGARLQHGRVQPAQGKGRASDSTCKDQFGRTVRLEIVGLLKNSIFQGDVLVGERAVSRTLSASQRLSLLSDRHARAAGRRRCARRWKARWAITASTPRRASTGWPAFFAVQNTYLSTFQSLGGLGLLLGTFGLATVQLRSVLERRGELALIASDRLSPRAVWRGW